MDGPGQTSTFTNRTWSRGLAYLLEFGVLCLLLWWVGSSEDLDQMIVGFWLVVALVVVAAAFMFLRFWNLRVTVSGSIISEFNMFGQRCDQDLRQLQAIEREQRGEIVKRLRFEAGPDIIVSSSLRDAASLLARVRSFLPANVREEEARPSPPLV